MTITTYHFHPELLDLMIQTIPLLFRSKRDVVMFFRGAGVPDAVTADISQRIAVDKDSITKYEIVRTVLGRLNDADADMLAQRREVIKRVCEFENYSSCWEDDRLRAKGLVSEIRDHVRIKDSFTRMQQEKDAVQKLAQQKHAAELEGIQQRKALLAGIKQDLFALFAEANPQIRGKALEGVLNRLFKAFGILIREDFKLRTADGKVVAEQIDGAIEFRSHVYLVEMKWWKDPLGVGEVAPHLVRVFGRADVRGMFISTSGYSEPAINNCKEALRDKTIVLCDLSEFVRLLEMETDLNVVLKEKVDAAQIEKNPFKRYVG
jgi:restriction system protein